MKAVVHIGWPKAGSSAIQDFLHVNAQELARRGVRFQRNVDGRGSQFEYPAAILGVEHFAHIIPLERDWHRIRSQQEIDAVHKPHLEALASYPRDYREPVAAFSSEHIAVWVRKPETIRAFDAHFRKIFTEVRYIAYLRDPIEFIPSEISERAKRGTPTPMQNFVNAFIRKIDWADRLKSWIEIVGRDRFDLRLLDKARLVNGNLLDDFCSALGVSPERLQAPEFENAALTLPGVLAMRRIMKHLESVDVVNGGANPLYRAAMRRVASLTEDGQKLRLNRAQKAQVEEATAGWQEELRALFFPDAPYLFAPKENGAPIRFKAADKRAEEVAAQVLSEIATKVPR